MDKINIIHKKATYLLDYIEDQSNAGILPTIKRELKSIKELSEPTFTRQNMIDAVEFGQSGLYGYQPGIEGKYINQINKFINSINEK